MPENEPLEEMIVNRGTTYFLGTDKFSRELSQNKVNSEIL